MTQIKIEVPSNDPIALSALGEALQRIATEKSGVPELNQEQFERYSSLCGGTFKPKECDNSSEESYERTVKLGDKKLHECKSTIGDISVSEKRITTEKSEKPDEEAPVKIVSGVIASDCKITASLDEGDLVTSSDIMEQELKHVDDTTEQYEAGGGVEDDTLDKDGLPWDKRIHSRGKTRLADDTWRLARKPNDKTQEEWDEYVASVKAELKAVQDIPAPSDTVTIATDVNNVEYQQTQGVISPDCKVEVTLDEQTPTETLTPPVVETEAVTPPTLDEQAVADVQASEPVAAVEPPTSVTAPVVDNTPSVSTFQELMKYITSDAAKRGATNDMIKEVLAQVDPSLTAIPLIANRADLIPTFVAKLEAKLS